MIIVKLYVTVIVHGESATGGSGLLVTLAKDGRDGIPVAAPARRGAGAISLLARADAWWPIPADQVTFAAGTEIEVFPIPGTS